MLLADTTTCCCCMLFGELTSASLAPGVGTVSLADCCCLPNTTPKADCGLDEAVLIVVGVAAEADEFGRTSRGPPTVPVDASLPLGVVGE